MLCGLCGAEDHTELECEYGMGQYDASDSEAQYIPENPSDDQEVIDVQADESETDYMETAQQVAPAMPRGFQSKLGIAQDLMTLAQSASSGDADTILRAMEQFSKAQYVRFLDITIIGPLLLFWAWRGRLSAGERTLMALIGLGTVIYNGRNYLANKTVIQPKELQAIKQELIETKMAGYR